MSILMACSMPSLTTQENANSNVFFFLGAIARLRVADAVSHYMADCRAGPDHTSCYLCQCVGAAIAGSLRALLHANNSNGNRNGGGNGRCNDNQTAYTIKSGDTLSRLVSSAAPRDARPVPSGVAANRIDPCSIARLARANPQIRDVNVFEAGARLCLHLGCEQRRVTTSG